MRGKSESSSSYSFIISLSLLKMPGSFYKILTMTKFHPNCEKRSEGAERDVKGKSESSSSHPCVTSLPSPEF